jgi:ABC-type antimicrobial peptide transport system permease subunit
VILCNHFVFSNATCAAFIFLWVEDKTTFNHNFAGRDQPFISCLGLFGLAAYTAERRAKEIGIRKVLGASTRGLAGLLSKEFLQLVTISSLIAFPLAWWAMKGWLQGYEYRPIIHWWVFAVAGALALVIALLTVSVQAIKTALANPIKALRSE